MEGKDSSPISLKTQKPSPHNLCRESESYFKNQIEQGVTARTLQIDRKSQE